MTPAAVSGLLVRKTGLVTAKRCMGSPAPWNYLWKPAPHADTEEKRLAAAKKYGMLPEDYKQYDPVTEADVMAGDYPKLPEKSAMIHLRDPFYPWDVPTLRRNFGEPLQENWMQYQEDRYTDMDGTFRYTRKQMVASQIAWFSFVLFAMWLCNGEHGIPLMVRPVACEQLVHDNYNPVKNPTRTWYTFDVPE